MHATESPAAGRATRRSRPRPLVVGHRGAPAYRPEHTGASFELAIDLGADFIEPDIVVSRDGALVVRHDRELSLSTDIASRPRFAGRRATKIVRGVPVEDWFVEDFDLAELRTLRAVEPMPDMRPLNTAYDGELGLMTLAEVCELAERRSAPARPVGVLVEVAPQLTGAGVQVAALLAGELRRLGDEHANRPLMIQSFEPAVLHQLRDDLGRQCPSLVQLVHDGEAHDHLVTPAGLREVSTYAQGLGPSRHRILLRDHMDALVGRSDLVHRAHEADLEVHVWKLLPENAFLPRQFRRGRNPADYGDAAAEVRALFDLGVDGVITDAPDIASAVCGIHARRRPVLTLGPMPDPGCRTML